MQSFQAWRKGTVLAIAGSRTSSESSSREVWIGKTKSNVARDQHNFEVQWLERQTVDSDSWNLTSLVDNVFRNSVISKVVVDQWNKGRITCVIDADEFNSLVLRLPEFLNLAVRGSVANLFTPQTPTVLTTSLDSTQVLALLRPMTPIACEVHSCSSYCALDMCCEHCHVANIIMLRTWHVANMARCKHGTLRA